MAVGRIVGPHGIRGEVKVEVLTDREERFAAGSRLLTYGRSGRGDDRMVIVASRPHKQNLLVRLEGVDDRDAAEALRGVTLEILREEVPPAPEGRYYYFDLVGCRCRDGVHGDLGTVEDVVDHGAGELLRVVNADGRELLLPFVDTFIEHVNMESREICWTLPEGLVETCGSA